MVAPAHIGMEHPNIVWLVVVGILAFVVGLGVNLYRSSETATPDRGSSPSDDR